MGSLYLFGPWKDGFLVGGGSLILLAALFFLDSPETGQFTARLSVYLLWAVNWPHFSATLQRLYQSPNCMMQFPLTAFASPILFALFGLLILSPNPVLQTVPIHLYALWAPYHFSSQSVGIAIIYSRRANIHLSRFERGVFFALCHSAMAYLVIRTESSVGFYHFGPYQYASLGLPPTLVPISMVGVALSIIAGCWIIIRRYRDNRKSLPPIVFLPILAQMSWFLIAPTIPSFNQLVPLFHSIQYLPFVLWTWVKDTGRKPFQWYRLNFLGGAILFWGIPTALTLLGIPRSNAEAAVFVAINLHHFWIDGVIWKLRDVRVSQYFARTSPA